MSRRVYILFPPRGHEPLPTLRDRLNPHLVQHMYVQRQRQSVVRNTAAVSGLLKPKKP